jgi:hypothetical protein
MQGPRLRRPVASVTALLVALSGCLALLASAPAASAASTGSAARQVSSSLAGSSGAAAGTSGAQSVGQVAGGVAGGVVAAKPKKKSTKAQRRAAAKRKKALKAARKAAKRKAKAARKAAVKARKAAARAAAKRKARLARIDYRNPRTWLKTSPWHYDPPSGPSFNNPYGSRTQRRALLTQVIRAINSTPGYVRPTNPHTHRPAPCPTTPKYYPAEIKIATYSIADRRFASAIINAARRCVSVKVLMNSHLTAVTSKPWGRIIKVLGKRGKHWTNRRMFARRCTNGCLGTSVLHSKIYMFSQTGTKHHTVMTGSSNMTRNAVGIQWNDLFTVNNNPLMYTEYRRMFARMIPDKRARGPWVYQAGPYQSYFYPFRKATRKTDSTIRALNLIRCKGAAAGSGIKGRTVIYINMHAWFGKRGDYVARKVRQLYRKGCYVRILYSFMSYPIFATLKNGTGKRMVVRRVLFPGPRGVVAAKYSHMKMIAASGSIGGHSPYWVVWTGSNNFTDRSNHADEVTLRIPSRTFYNTYVKRWKYMKKRRSTPVWAMFSEPEGGGRAPGRG